MSCRLILDDEHQTAPIQPLDSSCATKPMPPLQVLTHDVMKGLKSSLLPLLCCRRYQTGLNIVLHSVGLIFPSCFHQSGWIPPRVPSRFENHCPSAGVGRRVQVTFGVTQGRLKPLGDNGGKVKSRLQGEDTQSRRGVSPNEERDDFKKQLTACLRQDLAS